MKIARKTRARQACLSCNARRVRCNVVENRPCTNCEALNTPCILRESRRGKHPRRPKPSQEPKHPDNRQTQEDMPAPAPPEMSESISVGTTSSPTHVSPRSVSATEATTPGGQPAPPSEPTTVTPASLHQRSFPGQNEDDGLDDHLVASQTLAELSRNEISQPCLAPRSGQNDAEGNAAWTPQRNQPQGLQHPQCVGRQDDEDTVFLGESTSITYLHGTHPSPATPITVDQGLLYRLPEAARAKNLTSEWEGERKQARLRLLQAEGAFSFPPKPAVHKLLTAYFLWFHTCFAVLDEPDIWSQYRQGTLSPLLLQAILFIGVMHCPEEDLPCVGLGSRQRAKYILYNRAKDLFDAEAEPKALTVTQALFLMSFWRAGALLQKDTRHWLAVAVSMAQTKGLHRSSQDTDDKVYKLRKRLWWSIYVRERQCAAALGLPNRVRDEDCDVEALNDQDFQYTFDPSIPLPRVYESISYMVGMVELSRMLGRIMHRDFLPSKRLTSAEREEIKSALVTWRTSLPACMQVSPDELDSGLGFLASMLHLAYNNLLILLYRSGCGSLGARSPGVEGQVAIQAAARNSSIIENMVTEGQICHGQIHVITNVFNTLCIHTLNLRTLEGSRRFVAEHRAKLCLLSLQELQKTWEFKNWILQLFFQYLDQSTAKRLQLGDETGDGRSIFRQADDPQPINASGSSVDGQEQQQMMAASACDVPWLLGADDVGQFLHSQIENRFVNGEGGAIDWYMADLFDTALP